MPVTLLNLGLRRKYLEFISDLKVDPQQPTNSSASLASAAAGREI